MKLVANFKTLFLSHKLTIMPVLIKQLLNSNPLACAMQGKSIVWVLFIIVSIGLTSCNTGSKQESTEDTSDNSQANEEKATAKATMEAASGSKVTGEVTFTEEDGGVRFELAVDNLTPGEHAVHLHEKGDCSADDASSAGGHWNPTMKPHGKRDGGHAFHKGDIGNMNVGADGKGTMQMTVEGWSIGGADSTNVIGKSVIIHEKPDDFTTQPSGNAGARVSCGVIKAE
jgi:superoxide dismutase, Cu-Zn family